MKQPIPLPEGNPIDTAQAIYNSTLQEGEQPVSLSAEEKEALRVQLSTGHHLEEFETLLAEETAASEQLDPSPDGN